MKNCLVSNTGSALLGKYTKSYLPQCNTRKGNTDMDSLRFQLVGFMMMMHEWIQYLLWRIVEPRLGLTVFGLQCAEGGNMPHVVKIRKAEAIDNKNKTEK